MMAKADCQSLILSRQQKAMFVNFANRRFFVVAGFADCDTLPLGLAKIETSPAMFYLAFRDLRLELIATPTQVRDILEAGHITSAGYDGHDVTEISGLFSEITCFEVDCSYNVASTLERISGSYACRSYSSGPLMLDDDTKESLRFLFEDASVHIPFHLVLQGVLAFAWQTLFLEMYRCLEQLYAAPRLSVLSERLSLNQPLFDLADLLDETLTWRPKEDESLVKVLRYCSRSPVDEALQAFERDACEDYHQAVESAGRAIYQLRNSLVHFRASSQVVTLSDVRWNILIRAMISFIVEAYSNVGDRFYRSTSPT